MTWSMTTTSTTPTPPLCLPINTSPTTMTNTFNIALTTNNTIMNNYNKIPRKTTPIHTTTITLRPLIRSFMMKTGWTTLPKPNPESFKMMKWLPMTYSSPETTWSCRTTITLAAWTLSLKSLKKTVTHSLKDTPEKGTTNIALSNKETRDIPKPLIRKHQAKTENPPKVNRLTNKYTHTIKTTRIA